MVGNISVNGDKNLRLENQIKQFENKDGVTPLADQKYKENKTAKAESEVDKYGNEITKDIKNNELTTNDFLRIMMEQLKLQDPTKPHDMDKMLDSQMQMTTLNMNQDMIEALKSIQKTFNQSSLSNAAGIIGSMVENGSTTENGEIKEYVVKSIEIQDGEVIVVANEALYIYHGIAIEEGEGDDKKLKYMKYDDDGNIYDEKNEKTGEIIELESKGTPKIKDKKLIIKDKDGKEIAEHKYVLSGQQTLITASEPTRFPFSSITKVS